MDIPCLISVFPRTSEADILLCVVLEARGAVDDMASGGRNVVDKATEHECRWS